LCKVNRILQLVFELGMDNPPLPLAEPWPAKDKTNAGGTAVIMRHSLDPGRMEDTIQFETVRKMKSSMVNMAHAAAGCYGKPAVGGSEGKKYIITGDWVFHDWFDRFMRGMHNHMGDNVQQDLCLTADIMVKLMERLELEWKVTENGGEERLWITQLGVFCLAGYARALRGEEITKIELGGVRQHFMDDGTSATPHVMFTLVGRFKGEQGERHLFMPVAAITGSGLEVRKWTERLLQAKDKRGVVAGFMFARRDGSRAKSSDFEMDIAYSLIWVQNHCPGVIPKEVDIYAHFGVSRTFRRGTTTQALIVGLTEATIDANNRWRKVKRERGRCNRRSFGIGTWRF
jgi:hypothetical protein